ncbi:MAG: 3-phosphoserine/phosphohydroxythreonine transaminase [Armatimonadetes bacterium]|nr:3-phosphoserine/phosphohydroxythreonine transaminase [Armatimonadota bacterium]
MRVHNFNAGPAVLPLPVLHQVRDELVELPHLGQSVMEMSHRSKDFEVFLDRAENGLRRLLGLSDDFAVLFLGGGASLQFSMAPMNLLADGARADYLVHGSWGVKALKEAQKEGNARLAATTKDAGYRRVPEETQMTLDASAKYVHFTSNETIEGVQWPREPQTGGAPLVCDASSDILSRPIDIEKYGLIYAGAQKNIGPSGVTVVIIRRDWIEPRGDLPTMLSYATHAKERSLYNTPNTFGIYMVGLVCEWIESLGGLEGMARRSGEKAGLIYDAIDASDFYRGFAEKESRSQMNVTFRLPNEELERKFAAQSEKAGLIGLKGHRSVGGLRASIYNALEPEPVRVLVDFMREFERENG